MLQLMNESENGLSLR